MTQQAGLSQTFVDRSKAIEDELIAIRRHLHEHPELSFNEFETHDYVKECLNKWGIPYKVIGETGIVAHIQGNKRSEASAYTIGLRADLDALPIKEETDLPFASVNEGVMHACGHDGHTTILLGAARLLFENRDHFSGTAVCIFQPGEEADGAAKEMIRLGVLEDPEIQGMVGLHLWPYLPFGTVGIRSGSMAATCDEFVIEVNGKGGHSARPHEGIDAIAVSAQIIQAVQHLVNKMTDPLDPVVIHVGKIQGGSARNVISDHAVLEGSVRVLTTEKRKELADELTRLAQDIAASYKANANVEYIYGNSPVINDPQLTDLVGQAAAEQWGEEMVAILEKPSLGADDFGEFSQIIPSCYFRLGIHKQEQETYSLHHPKFDFDDKLVSRGAAVFANIAVKTLNTMEDKNAD